PQLSTEVDRFPGPYLFARRMEAAVVDFVATLERSINVFTIGSWGRRGAAVFRMHFFAFGGQCSPGPGHRARIDIDPEQQSLACLVRAGDECAFLRDDW